MNANTPTLQVFSVELPASAPQVRITAGVGSAAQKTWNLRRPVTLIGSRRPAHIVLHDGEISPAHCIIVNTGREILLKDLHTSGGTLCNGTGTDLTVLKDGDVVAVGASKIQVAIHVPEDDSDDSACGLQYADPTAFPTPVKVGLVHTDQQWEFTEAVVLVGKHEAAPIHLDHPAVARRHAVFFQLLDGLAVFEVGGQTGLLVNGSRCSIAPLQDGDSVTIGPFGLRIGSSDRAQLDLRDAAAGSTSDAAQDSTGEGRPDQAEGGAGSGAERRLDEATGTSDVGPPVAADPRFNVPEPDPSISWPEADSCAAALSDEPAGVIPKDADLASLEEALEARDAALRGQLHDVMRYSEQIAERERELAVNAALIQEGKDILLQDRAACKEREAELTRRTEDLSRREHVLAQRWTRLKSAKCSHCGRPVAAGHTNSPL